MSARRSIILLVLAALTLVAHEILLAVASNAHVAHRLLGAGNGAPPIGAAVLALTLLVVRLVAIVLVPGAVLASLASLFAHVAVGPIDRQRESAGKGTSSGAGSSVADGTGTSIEARGAV